MKLIKDLGTNKLKKYYRFGIYECPVCLKNFEAKTVDVNSGKSTKCISCSNRIKNTKHGMSKTRLYSIYINMKDRCYRVKNKDFLSYGGRGISVCKEWKNDFMSFYTWAMSNGYQDELTIDRIDVNGNYESSNCRFSNSCLQSQNIRQKRKNNTSGYKGVSYSKIFKKWIAYISISKKRKHLGYFDTAIKGAKAYNEYVINNNLEHTLNEIKD